jgi:hypothetical protein
MTALLAILGVVAWLVGWIDGQTMFLSAMVALAAIEAAK